MSQAPSTPTKPKPKNGNGISRLPAPLASFNGAFGVDMLLRSYGPIAFGMVSLFAIWGFIVSPELKQARADRVSNDAIVEAIRSLQSSVSESNQSSLSVARSMSEIAGSMKDSSRSLESSSATMKNVASHMQNIADKMEKVQQ